MQKTAIGGKPATLHDVARMLQLLIKRGPGKQVPVTRALRRFKNPLFHGDYRFPDFSRTAIERVPEGGGKRGLIYSTPNADRATHYALQKTPKVKSGFGFLTVAPGDKMSVRDYMWGSPLIPAQTLSRLGKVYIQATKMPRQAISVYGARKQGPEGLARMTHMTDASLLVNLHKLRTRRPEFRKYIDPVLKRFDASALEADRLKAMENVVSLFH